MHLIFQQQETALNSMWTKGEGKEISSLEF